MGRRSALGFTLLLAAQWGCGGREREPADSGTTGDGGDAGVMAPEPPLFTPCPAGWHLVDGEPATCEPFADPRPPACTGVMGHFAGDVECVSPGVACPTTTWQEEEGPPEWLAIARHVYVQAGATGGVGTPTAPFGTIDQAIADARGDTLILVSAGTYDEVLRIPDGVYVWGACPEQTSIISSEPREGTGIVNFVSGTAGIGNVQLGPSPRPGIIAAGVGVSSELAGVSVTGTESVGVFVTREAELSAFNLVVADTGSRPSDGWVGRGLDVTEAGYVTLAHAVFRGNHDTGISALDNGTRVELEDVVVRDTLGRESDGWFGRGIVAQGGASISGTEVVVLNARDTGIGVLNDAVVALDQVVVRDTQSDAMGLTGRGIAASGATFRGSRLLIDDNRDTGIMALSPTMIDVSHVLVREVRGRELDGSFGLGMVATAGATIEGDHVRIERAREVGITVDGGSTAHVADLVIADTLLSDCTVDCGNAFGIGVSSFGVSELELTRFQILRSALAGVQVGDPPPGPAASVTLVDGEITDAPIGVNLQPTSYDFSSLTTRVTIDRVERVIDASFLPLPVLETE